MSEKKRNFDVNPPEVYAGLGPGPGSAYSHLGKKVDQQIQKSVVVKDLIDLLQRMPLTDSEVEQLYLVIHNRAHHRICQKCGKLRITIGGKWEIHPSLDLSKPKAFICKDCL